MVVSSPTAQWRHWRPGLGDNVAVHISAKTDYAVRALLTIAARAGEPVSVVDLATTQELPRKFLESILGDLRRAGMVRSQRGAYGGYVLAQPATEVTVGDVFRAVDGPLAEVRGLRPQQTSYDGAAEHLQVLWVALRSSLRSVLDETTLQDLLEGRLPEHVVALANVPDAWTNR